MKGKKKDSIEVTLDEVVLLHGIVTTLVDAWLHSIKLPPPVVMSPSETRSKGNVSPLLNNTAYMASQVVQLIRSLAVAKP